MRYTYYILCDMNICRDLNSAVLYLTQLTFCQVPTAFYSVKEEIRLNKYFTSKSSSSPSVYMDSAIVGFSFIW